MIKRRCMTAAMRIRFALGVLLCVQALLGVCAIGEPMDRDEGVYAYTAQIWRSGGAPYRDVWDQKPPGIYAIHAVGQMLAGPETVLGARMISLLANLLTTLCLFRIASRWFGPAAGLVAAACSALYLGAPFIEGNQSNTEPFLTLFLTAALDVFTSKSDRAVWLATGACLGCALLFKPSGIFCLLVLGFWPAPDAARRLIPARLGMIAAGAAAAWVPFLAYTFAAGAFDDFWNQVIVYNAVDASIRLHGIDVFRLFGLTILNLAIHENLALWLGAIVGLCLPPARTKIDALLIFWFAATILGSLAGGLAYPHYFISLVPPLALIAARPFQSGRRMLWGACLTAVALVQLSVHLPDYLEPGEALSQKKYPGQVFARTGPIADAIRQRVSPGDAVWVFGSEADRKSVV